MTTARTTRRSAQVIECIRSSGVRWPSGVAEIGNLGLRLRLFDQFAIHVADEESHRDVELDVADLPSVEGEGQLALDLSLGCNLIVSSRTIRIEESIGDCLAHHFAVQTDGRLNRGANDCGPVEINASHVRRGRTHRGSHLAELWTR